MLGLRRLPVIAAAALAAAIATPASAKEWVCERTCLEGYANDYLDALVARDPSRLKLANGARYTENAIEIGIGEGLWKTITAVESYRIYIADPQSRQVAYMGMIRENGFPKLFSLRLKLDNGRISEIESGVVRTGGMFWDRLEGLNLTEARPGFSQTLAPSQRRSREEMVRIANLYFEGIEQSDGEMIPFASDCDRWENGISTAGVTRVARAKQEVDPDPLALGCGEQITLVKRRYTTSVKPRRFSVIDEERGLVFGTFVFNIAGNVKEMVLRDGRTIPTTPYALSPFSGPMQELFRIRDGKIVEIEAVLQPVGPYMADTGWPVRDWEHVEGAGK